MRLLGRIVRHLDRAEDLMVFLLCVDMFLAGVYGLYDSYLVYREANDSSILKYKPGSKDTGNEEKEIQGNMVAWLTLDGTGIDFPVMQGETNTEYLNKNPFGEYSLSGSIFLDSRNSPDFRDGYSLVYGHHMEGGMMFGALDAFLDRDFFDTHKSGKLTVGEVSYPIRIFAVIETEATNERVFAPTETDVSGTLGYIKRHAVFIDGDADVGGGKPILGMSTCKYPDTVDRTVVFGVIG